MSPRSLALTALLAFAACDPGRESPPAAEQAPSTLVAPAPIGEVQVRTTPLRLGASLDLGGPDSRRARSYAAGIEAAFAAANAAGGVQGQTIELVVLDDLGRPATAAANIRRLMDEHQVLLITGVGSLCDTVVQTLAQQYGAMLFAPLGAAMESSGGSRVGGVANLRAGIDSEMSFAVRLLVEHAQVEPARIAFVTQRDGIGEAAFTAGAQALQVHGVRSEQILRLRTDPQVASIEVNPQQLIGNPRSPQAYVIAANCRETTGFLLAAKAMGVDAMFVAASLVLAREMDADLGVAGDRLIVLSALSREAGQEVAAGLPAGTEVDSAAREGWLAGRVLTAALLRCGANPSRVQVADAVREVLADGRSATPELGGWLGKDGGRGIWPLVLTADGPRLLDPAEMATWEVRK